MPNLFDHIGKKRKRVSPGILDLLEESPTRTSASRLAARVGLKTPVVPGVKTLVTPKSEMGLPTDTDRTKEVVLPPGSATPGGEGRDIGKFEMNTNRKTPHRSISIPGEEYGVPYKNDYGNVTRRTMTGNRIPGGLGDQRIQVEMEHSDDPDVAREITLAEDPEYYDKLESVEKHGAWKQRWKPGQRQKKQRGQSKTKSRQYYRKNRSKIRMKQKKRRRSPAYKNNPARKRSEKRRQKQNRRRTGSLVACPSCLAARFMEAADFAPSRERGGEGGRQQRKQPPEQRREDAKEYRQNRGKQKTEARRYYHRYCKNNPKCQDRREKYREDPDYYKRKAPRMGSVLTVPDIAFVVGNNMSLGYVNSISSMTGMVTFQLAGTNVSQLNSLPVEVFLRAVTLLSDEDVDAFFELVEVEIGLEAYDDLDEEGLRECAGLYDVDPGTEGFKNQCFQLVGETDIESMSAAQIDTVNDRLVMGILEGGGEPRTQDNADDGDETIGDEYDPHLFYGEVESRKTASGRSLELSQMRGIVEPENEK